MGDYVVITIFYAIVTILMSAVVLLIEVFIWAIIKLIRKFKHWGL